MALNPYSLAPEAACNLLDGVPLQRLEAPTAVDVFEDLPRLLPEVVPVAGRGPRHLRLEDNREPRDPKRRGKRCLKLS